MSTDTTAEPEQTGARRSRRAEPITRRTARSGAVSYEFRIDVGVKADGSRDRRRFTYPTYKQARDEFRRISAEVRKGVYVRRSDLTVNQAIDAWLSGRRNIRTITAKGYTDDLRAVRARLGGPLQQVSKADGDELVAWMMAAGRADVRHHLPESLSGRIAAMIDQHPEGVATSVIAAAFPDKDVHTPISGLLRTGRVTRVRRAVYAPATEPSTSTKAPPRGVGAVAVRATLRTFTAVMQSYVDQGTLVRNPIALVERPRVSAVTAGKSWNVAEVAAFIDSVRDHRLFACWLLSCYGLRRSEVMGLRWSDIAGDVLAIRRGRVSVGAATVVDDPKSARSRRNLPMPVELAEALRALKIRCKAEALELGVGWSDERHIAVHEDGKEIRPEWFSDEFHKLRERAGLRRIKLHGLHDTSTSLMYASGIPPHVVSGWHGHSAQMSLSVYSHAQPEDLRAAGAALFGRNA